MTYTIERGPGYRTTVTLSHYRLRIPAPTTAPEWVPDDDLAVLDATAGIRIVPHAHDEAVASAAYTTVQGRRKIAVAASVIRDCMAVDNDDRVVVYDRPDEAGLRVVPAASDPFAPGGDA